MLDNNLLSFYKRNYLNFKMKYILLVKEAVSRNSANQEITKCPLN